MSLRIFEQVIAKVTPMQHVLAVSDTFMFHGGF
jgi:hypothetical protein